MPNQRSQKNYEPVLPSRPQRRENDRGSKLTAISAERDSTPKHGGSRGTAITRAGAAILKRGHTLSFIGLFLFSVVLYARPAEFFPSPVTASLALILGIFTLVVFVPTQFSLEGTATAPIREVHLVLLFALIAFASIPLAISPADAWQEFSGVFIRCVVIFIVMVNVARTPSRLKALLLLTVAVSIWLSIGALNDYRLGLATVEGYRVGGRGDGIFGNPNDMALHLVTVIPITIALFFTTRRFILRIIYAVSALAMISAVIVTFSRGGFLGLLAATGFLAYKLGYRQRLTITVAGPMTMLFVLILAPGNYPMRLASIFIPSLDPVGSSGARREILIRSIMSAIRHPLLGLGMGNFHIVSIHEQVTHNAYTQVAAELGVAALVIYLMFLVGPWRKLGQIVTETRVAGRKSNYYYLAVGLQASLLAYMVSSFFASVAYLWYVYYLVAYAVCLRRLYEAETGKPVIVDTKRQKRTKQKEVVAFIGEKDALTT